MAAYQTSKPSPFTTTILSRTSLNYSTNLSLYTHLSTHTSEVQLLLTTQQKLYFSEFEYYTRRLTTFLYSITGHALSSTTQPPGKLKNSKPKDTPFTPGAQTVLPIPEAFINHLILPLFISAKNSVDEGTFVSSAEFLDLITAVLGIYIPQSLSSKSSLKPLHNLLKCLLLVPSTPPSTGLLERFIASQQGGELLAKLIGSKGTVSKVFNAELLELYICRITALIGACVVSHGTAVERALGEWVDVVILKSALEGFKGELEGYALGPKTIRGSKKVVKEKDNLPDLNKMRVLNPKSSIALKLRRPVIEIPPPQLARDSVSMLRSILGSNTKPPQSPADIENILKALRTAKTFLILSRVVCSFPCAACTKTCSGRPEERNVYGEEPGVNPPGRVEVRENVAFAPGKVHHISSTKGKDRRDKGNWIADKTAPTANIPEVGLGKRQVLPAKFELPNLLPAEDWSPASKLYNPSSLFPALPGPWRLVLSTQAMKDLIEAQHDGTFPVIKRVLEELATGDWSRRGLTKPHKAEGISSPASDGRHMKWKDVKKDDKGVSWELDEWKGNGIDKGGAVLKLYKAIYSKNHRVLWGVEGAWDEQWGGWRQIVKVWRIGDHKEILESIPGVLRAHRGYSADFIRGCKLREPENGMGKYLPARFVLSGVSTREEGGSTSGRGDNKKLTREEALGLHEAITTGKFYTLSERMLESLQESRKSGVLPEFAFDVSEEETSILRWWRSSVLILGRSGTGKTTCLVFKLLAAYLARTGTGMETRQIFLTRSPILAEKIRRYIKRLIDSHLCQFENVLAEVENDEVAGHRIRERGDKDPDDEKNLFTLGKGEWPLVCTFDEFCGLVEKTLKVADRASFISAKTAGIQLDRDHRRVDFGKFKRSYWPSFPQNLKKMVSVDLVFSELMGMIKGGNYDSEFMPLTKDAYLDLSSRLAPTFLEGSIERECIWGIYELYEERRRHLGEWDDLDRCRVIREGLGKDIRLVERLKRVVGECFVDEVQDLRMGEVEILLRIVGNPRGVHLAGDTAQCISRDSTFRFQDVKALFFRFFGPMVGKEGSGSSKTTEGSLEKPKLFLLSKNYRSHQGILALAGSVVELLWKVFPDVIDKLQPEVGQYLGPKPKLFVGFSSDIFSTRLFGIVNAGENMAEFGAEQVILVRDDEAREALRKEIGKVNLILTVVESKGMEFEDVLLFNYFSGSPAGGSFRALVAMEEEGETSDGRATASLDRRKHVVLCAELKGLYVAITRPRARLWLIEEFEKNISAMARLWMKGADGGLVDLVQRGDVNAADMMKDMRQGNSNKPADWYRKGLEFLEKKLWQPALQCFEKAGDETGKNLSKAYLSEQKALDRAYENPEEAKGLFRQAASLFLTSEHPRQASKCFATIQDWTSAAGIWEAHGEHERAASFYEKAGCFKKAAQQYHLGGQFVKAAGCYREGEHFADLLQYLISDGQKIEPVMFRRFSRLVNALFRSRDDVDKDLKLMAIQLLGSDSEKEAFLVQYDMHEEIIQHYVSTGQIMNAVRICVNSGDYQRAADLIKAYGTPNNVNLGVVDEIFRWTETKRLQVLISTFAGHDLDAKKVEKQFLPQMETPPPLVSDNTREKWIKLGKCLAAWFSDCKAPGDQDEGAWIDEDLQLTGDLLITTNGAHFGNKGNPRDFPFQPVARCAEAVKQAFRDGRPPAALARFYGLSYIEDCPNVVWILAPSPLLKDGKSRKEDRGTAFKALNEQLSGDMAKNAYFLQEKAFELLREESLCEEFAVKGTCKFRLQEGGCRRSEKGHAKLSRSVALSRLELLNASSEIMMALGFPYQKRLFKNDDHSVAYRGTVRKWLEQLLSTTTFISEFTTHPLINIASLYSTPRESERGIRHALEELLYHRMDRDDKMWNFSGLLEEMDLADSLNVGGTFSRFIIGRIKWETLSQKKWDSFSTFANILHLRDALQAGDVNNVFDYMWQIFPMMSALDSQEMRYFHAMISFWEQCCAFLIVISSPSEFLIKDNWRKTHFSYFLRYLGTYEGLSITNREEIIESAKMALDMAVQHILRLLGKLQLAQTSTMRSAFNKRPDILIRRVLDLLGLCLCNIQQPVGTMHQIKVIMTPCLESIVDEWNHWSQKKFIRQPTGEKDVNRFMVGFADAFNESYGGIEALGLFQRSDVRQPQSKFRMMKPSWQVKRTTFPSFLEFNRKLVSRKTHTYYKPPTVPRKDGPLNAIDPIVGSSLTMAESKAVSMIQAFWRKWWPLLLERREFEKTELGKAAKVIEGLCKELKNPINETLVRRRLRLFVLRESGVPAYLKIMHGEKLLDENFTQMKADMKKKDLEWTRRETLDERYLQLQRVREEVTRLRGFFVLGQVLGTGSADDLRWKLGNIEAQAEGLWEEARSITKIVE